MFDSITNFLQILNLNINDDDLPGQSYDNGANMRGKNNGLRQKKILEIKLTLWLFRGVIL